MPLHNRAQKHELLGLGYLRQNKIHLSSDIVHIIIKWLNEIYLRDTNSCYDYAASTETVANFTLKIECGTIAQGELIVLIGESGTGKTTFLKSLSNHLDRTVSYKPQKVCCTFDGTFKELLCKKIPKKLRDPQFVRSVIKPLRGDELYHMHMQCITGGALQRMALIVCLAKDADLYLIDQPSEYLDAEQRMIAAKVIKQWMLMMQRSAFVVENDLMMANYFGDSAIVFEKVSDKHAIAKSPQSLAKAMNTFLKEIGITMRRDPMNWRPMFNKPHSIKDIEQKRNNMYFYL